MKILLSSANFCIEPLPVYPLGMGVIAGVLAGAGHEVAQFDPFPCGATGYAAAAERRFREFRPELIGISIRNLDVTDSQAGKTDFFRSVCDVIAVWRRIFAGPIVLGGPGFSLNPEAWLRNSDADFGIAGEGETAILELVDALRTGNPPPRGTVLRRPAGAIAGARYSRAVAAYYDRETHNLPIQTKRGCPFRCSYCTYPMLEGRTLRFRPLERVLDDIGFIRREFPEAMIYFTDSVFNDPDGAYRELLRAMIDRGLTAPWTGFITPYRLGAGDIDLMVRSGLVCADLGIDGASDSTLTGMGKKFTFAEARDCCRRFLAAGVGVNANAMFGGPGETWETVARGIENMRGLEPVFSIVFSGIRVLRGAPLFETARAEGRIPPGWDDSTPLYYYAPGIDPVRLHEELLRGFADSAYCVYPPSSRSDDFRRLHKFGYAKLHAMHLGRSRRRGTSQ